MVFGKYINKYYLKYLWVLITGLASLLAVDYAQLVIPKLYRMLLLGINTGFIDADKTIAFSVDVLLSQICLPILIITAVMLAGRFLWRVCFFGSSVRVETAIRKIMFDHASTLSPQYYNVNKVGDLMSLFTNDLSNVEESFGWGVMMFFDASVLGVMAIYNMFIVQPVLAALCLIPVAILVVIGLILNKYMTVKWDERQASFSRISDFAQENFSGLSVVKAFVKEALELMRFKKINLHNEKVNVEFTRLAVLLRIMVTLFVEAVIGVILGFGGYLVWKKSIQAEFLIEFIGYFTAIIWPAMAISELIDVHSRGKASLKRITEFLDAPVDVKDREGAKDVGILNGTIEFCDLTFRYPLAEYDAIKDLSVRIEAGESVGVVGRIGSGKSTFADLILRAYNVPDGTLFFDGMDVNDLTIESVRRNCAYVPQDNFLFSDTVGNNIAFSSDHTDEEIRQAAVFACIDNDVDGFADRYDTVLGERGVTVSGGQKQRISIARALLKNAPILILDDSVSAVDTETEKRLLHNLAATRENKTTILIAHRISTVKDMDKILFFDDGTLLACGKHEDLIKSCPEYARAVELQKLEERRVD